MAEAIEGHLRIDEHLDPGVDLVVRGWPLTVEGLLTNAGATQSRFSYRHQPLVAVSAEVSITGWTAEIILGGPRLRTRSRYAQTPVAMLIEAGFELLPSFAAPHYSIVLPAYDESSAQLLLEVLGEPRLNPYYVGRRT